MFYIHHTACISPQQSFLQVDLERLLESVSNKLRVIEPDYKGIPPGLLRRMGKAVKIGVGAALSLLQENAAPHGIILGTANGGMEDCIKFLNQIIEYDEGILAPGNFVQSTTNAIASQLGLLTRNKSYNVTHVHRGLAFENAMMDAAMMIAENPSMEFLVGAVDEISTYNYNIDYLDGWYKKQSVSNLDLYETQTDGSLAGEGAAMFLVNADPESAIGSVKAVHCLHTEDESVVAAQLKEFIKTHSPVHPIDWLVSGENGDRRLNRYYEACERVLDSDTGICRFKHMSGEFPTASAVALWIACYMLQEETIPRHMTKRLSGHSKCRNLLIYNNFKSLQHSFMLVTRPGM
jgi:hypothetical protein